MATSWSIEQRGRTVEVVPDAKWSGTVVELRVDGEPVASAKASDRLTVTVAAASLGLSVKVWTTWVGAIRRAELTVDGEAGEPRPLKPAAGSRAARLEEWGEAHPALFSARHALGGVGQVLIGLIGLGLLLRLLPSIPIDLPDPPEIDLPLPSIPLPSIDVDLPSWITAIAESSRWWLPVVIGLVVAKAEYDRRRRQARRAAEEAERDAAAIDASAQAAGSSRANSRSSEARSGGSSPSTAPR